MIGKRRFTTGVAALLGILGVAPVVQGQDQAAPAEQLFEDGRALLAQRRYAEACPKLAASEKLDPAVGTLLNLGDCYEKMGKIATAWATFKEAVAMARAGKQPGREKIAAARADALEAHIPRLSIVVPHAVPGLEVRRDGLVVGQAEWTGAVASAVPLDPGEHEIVVLAPTKRSWSTTVVLAADGHTSSVEVPELETDELAERAPLKPVSQAAATLEVVNTHDRNVQRALGLIIGGAGLVTAVVGAPFGFIAISQNKLAESNCPTNDTCHEPGGSDAKTAVTDSIVSTVLVFVGSGIAIGGAVVFFTAPKPKHEPSPKATLHVTPSMERGGGGLRLSGSF
jgi:hypothetical protein